MSVCSVAEEGGGGQDERVSVCSVAEEGGGGMCEMFERALRSC